MDGASVPARVRAIEERERHCHAAQDGECHWRACPQLRDGEPVKSGRHCPLDRSDFR